jgi:hypothetical protein
MKSIIFFCVKNIYHYLPVDAVNVGADAAAAAGK